MNTTQTNTPNADLTDDAEIPAADMTAMFSGLGQQRAPAASLAANDDATPADIDADCTSTSKAIGSPSVHMSRDRALTLNTIGPRLIAARELNGIQQQEAARLAGMGNPTQWSQWEQGRRAPPLYAVLAAANTLHVSLDFLFGLSEDPERDARAARRNACVRAVHSMLTKTAETIADGIEASDSLAGPDASNVRELLDAGSALTTAVERFHQLNIEQFEDSRGGATVLAALGRMEQVQFKIRDVLRRHDAFGERVRVKIAAIGPLAGEEDQQPRVACAKS